MNSTADKGGITTNVRRAHGRQAAMALEDLKLVRVTEKSAEFLFGKGIKLVVVACKINSHHFFKNTSQAFAIDSQRWVDEGRSFATMAGSWSQYNEHPSTGTAAFYVELDDYNANVPAHRAVKAPTPRPGAPVLR